MEGLVADAAALTGETGPLLDAIPPSGIDEVLHEDDTITIMVIATPNGIEQPPHDHGIPAIIGVFDGKEEQRFFVRSGNTLRPVRGRVLHAEEPLSVDRYAELCRPS